PVEWMLATGREEQIRDTVASRIPEVIGWMKQIEDPIHLTRDLVHRFFSPAVVDDTYDIHAYFKALSTTLTQASEATRIWVEEAERKIEAWCSTGRVRELLNERIDLVSDWLCSIGKPQGIDAISHKLLQSYPQLASAAAVLDQVSDLLARDLRFLFDDAAGGWRAIPSGPQENLPAYHILWEERRPLSEGVLTQKISDLFANVGTGFNLADDERFRMYHGKTWGLSQWIDIGDWAYEHLRKTKAGLQASTIKSRVCQELGIPVELAIFSPENDPRFVRRANGRWACRHLLSDSQLAEMLALLDEEEDGLTLGELVGRAIKLAAQETDAAERLADDERFVLLEGRWFAREKIVYALTDQDLEQLLETLRLKGTGLRLTTLVQQVLDREAHLTDAEERLKADSRFKEINPGVWATADLEPVSGERRSIFNRPIRSAEISVVPENEYTEVEELTERESWSRPEKDPIHIRQITLTLSLLDVQHGNMVVDRAMAGLIPEGLGEAVHFTDELGDEFTAWIDEENDLLQGLGNWFEARELTFGDKVRISRGAEAGFLEIEPTGQRDERVHEEALQRQDVENLIQDAGKAGKSYHDLMIEVMKSLNQAAGKQVRLHREDIYDLVNHRRTASRSYIFQLLSLTDCPYEELRYFVPHGDGYWSFDPGRRKAFEMKMKELVEEVERLEAQKEHLQQSLGSAREAQEERSAAVDNLAEQVRIQASRISEMVAENDRLSEKNEDLKNENERLHEQIAELDTRVVALQGEAAKQAGDLEAVHSERKALARELADVEEERDQLCDSQRTQAEEIEVLKGERAAFHREVERLASENATMREGLGELQARVETLTSEKVAASHELEQARAVLKNLVEESRTSQERLQKELDRERQRGQELNEQIQALERRSAAEAKESAQLRARLGQARDGLDTVPGKGFVALLRVLGGPDLSDL
ncbi:MAG: hypothetical protein ACOC6F_02235, partial [bacterium]